MKDNLEKINKEVAVCQNCPLSETRQNAVPGEGSSRAKIMFVGEGPGKKEDGQGRPFVGAAGKILDSLLEVINLKREDVFITNVVKCRPPLNRDPLPEEVSPCSGYLARQVALIRPRIVVLLGRHAMDRFLPGLKISLAHGKPQCHNGQVYYPIYHPAATIYNQALRGDLERDFKRIPKIIKAIESGAKSDLLDYVTNE